MTDKEDTTEDIKPEAREEAKLAAAEEVKADAVAESEVQPEAEVAAAAEAKPEPKAKAEAKAEAKAKPEPKPKPEVKAKAAPKKKAKSKKKVVAKAIVSVPAVRALSDKEAKLNPEIFAIEPRIGVLHEAARAELAARRGGNASTKKRGEVRGGGVKPWRQKGTGRARAGSSRMPHWTGGGVAFGPKPRDYRFKINRKVRAKALKMALSARASEGSIKVIDGLPFEEPKTAAAAAVLESLKLNYPVLVLVDDDDANAAMSFRNLPKVTVCNSSELGVADIMSTRTVLLTKQVLEQLNSLGVKK
ncbi:MAG: 50S ribosomal protein L4 [Actinomycetota bacterium]